MLQPRLKMAFRKASGDDMGWIGAAADCWANGCGRGSVMGVRGSACATSFDGGGGVVELADHIARAEIGTGLGIRNELALIARPE